MVITCPICNAEFESDESLQEHMQFYVDQYSIFLNLNHNFQDKISQNGLADESLQEHMQFYVDQYSKAANTIHTIQTSHRDIMKCSICGEEFDLFSSIKSGFSTAEEQRESHMALHCHDHFSEN